MPWKNCADNTNDCCIKSFRTVRHVSGCLWLEWSSIDSRTYSTTMLDSLWAIGIGLIARSGKTVVHFVTGEHSTWFPKHQQLHLESHARDILEHTNNCCTVVLTPPRVMRRPCLNPFSMDCCNAWRTHSVSRLHTCVRLGSSKYVGKSHSFLTSYDRHPK